MIRLRNLTVAFGAIFVAGGLSYAAPASAQATRTWVSGVGDDVNPCSRTAPCKTFAGAISKTATNGEINCLDPASYGAVTITKAISIVCQYTEAGALGTLGSNAIVVNAPAAADVYLSGLDLQGAATGLNGVRFIAGGSLTIENCLVRNFGAASGHGISFQPTGASRLVVRNCTIASNGAAGSGSGIFIAPTTATGNARVQILDSRIVNNLNEGIRVDATGTTNGAAINVNIENSQVTGGATGIVIAGNAGNSSIKTTIINSVVNNNTIGLHSFGPGSRIEVGLSTITDNTTPLQFSGGGVIFSYGNNRTSGNGAAVVFTAPNLTQN
jgi:hypothetical protein